MAQKVGEQKKKPENPKDGDGNFFLCKSCGSFRHMLDSCPHSWEKMESGQVASENTEQSFFTSGLRVKQVPQGYDCDDIILYTGQNKMGLTSLCKETQGSVVLDCGCTNNVCGELWLEIYSTALSEADRQSMKEVMNSEEKKVSVWRRRGVALSEGDEYTGGAGGQESEDTDTCG